MDRVLLIIVASAIAILLVLLLVQIRSDRSVQKIWRSLKTEPSDTVFAEDLVANLDEPVRRYFLQAIKPGAPLASYIELNLSGSF
ncbi:MAG: hypothetical protein QNJ72_13730 [Pleurocapsa sp. MO_226.B13]|nr:hypothetical protein [Pleurocapsa sp. MO_226.B13]